MEKLIAQAKGQFDQILSYIQGDAQNQQLNEVEKGIFYALLKLGLTLLLMFFQQKGVGHKGKVHIDKESVKRSYHSIKHREYLIYIWPGKHSKGLLLGKGVSRGLPIGC
jgi:hypothetical protein